MPAKKPKAHAIVSAWVPGEVRRRLAAVARSEERSLSQVVSRILTAETETRRVRRVAT